MCHIGWQVANSLRMAIEEQTEMHQWNILEMMHENLMNMVLIEHKETLNNLSFIF